MPLIKNATKNSTQTLSKVQATKPLALNQTVKANSSEVTNQTKMGQVKIQQAKPVKLQKAEAKVTAPIERNQTKAIASNQTKATTH